MMHNNFWWSLLNKNRFYVDIAWKRLQNKWLELPQWPSKNAKENSVLDEFRNPNILHQNVSRRKLTVAVDHSTLNTLYRVGSFHLNEGRKLCNTMRKYLKCRWVYNKPTASVVENGIYCDMHIFANMWSSPRSSLHSTQP